MTFPNHMRPAKRRELGREWGLRSVEARECARLATGPDADTLRRRALHDARGTILRHGCIYTANAETHWQVVRSVAGRTDQRDILVNNQLHRTCGPRRLPAWLR
jgi:hypothetical protein